MPALRTPRIPPADGRTSADRQLAPDRRRSNGTESAFVGNSGKDENVEGRVGQTRPQTFLDRFVSPANVA